MTRKDREVRLTVRTVLTAGVWIVFLVLGVSGVAKLTDIPRFVEHVEDWTLVPSGLTLVVAMLVPAVEVVLAGLWGLAVRRRLVAIAGLALSLALLGVSLTQWMLDPVPACGCFGALAAYIEFESTLPKLIGINGAMSAALLLCVLAVPRRRPETRSDGPVETKHAHPVA